MRSSLSDHVKVQGSESLLRTFKVRIRYANSMEI